MHPLDQHMATDHPAAPGRDINALLDRLFEERQAWLHTARQAEQQQDHATANKARQHMARIATEAAFLLTPDATASAAPADDHYGLVLFTHHQQKGN